MSTLLTSGAGPDPARQESERAAFDFAAWICSQMLEAFRDGGMSLEHFARSVRKVLTADGIGKFERRKALGELIELALDSDPKPRGRGHPPRAKWLARFSFEMVEVVNRREGLSIADEPASGQTLTAYDRAAEFMRKFGIHDAATWRSVKKHRDDWRAEIRITGSDKAK